MKGQGSLNSPATLTPHSPPPPVHSPGMGTFTPAPAFMHTCTLTYRLHTQQQTHAQPHHLPPHTEPQAHSCTCTQSLTQLSAPALLHTHQCTRIVYHQVHSDMHTSSPHAQWHTHLLASLQHAYTHAQSTHWQVLWIHWNNGQFLVTWPTPTSHPEGIHYTLCPSQPHIILFLLLSSHWWQQGTDSCSRPPVEMGH